MPVISNKPLPEGHPLKKGLITFGPKQTGSSQTPSASDDNISASPEEAAANAYEQAISLLAEDMIRNEELKAVSTAQDKRSQQAVKDCELALSRQDQLKDHCETKFTGKQVEIKPFEIKVQKGEQSLAVSPTQAWRKDGWQRHSKQCLEEDAGIGMTETGQVGSFSLENYKSGVKSSAIPLAKLNQSKVDPMKPAADAVEAQIRQWGNEATVGHGIENNDPALSQGESNEPQFVPMSAQDEQNDILETAYYKDMLEKNKSSAKPQSKNKRSKTDQ